MDFYSNTGVIIYNEDEIDVSVDLSFFMNCTGSSNSGVIRSTNGLSCNISLCCFSQCDILSGYGSVAYIVGISQVINKTTIFKCGKGTSQSTAYFEGEHSDISRTNFSKSKKDSSVSSFTHYTNNPKISYVNTAQCESINGVALYANHCSDAFVKYTNIVNNSNVHNDQALIYFYDTSVKLSHVITINNTGFTFSSHQASTVVATDSYSDVSSNFGFIIDTEKNR